MSLLELKKQAASLPIDEQAELASFLAEQLRRDDPAYRRELSARLDDRDPQHWVRWDEVKKLLTSSSAECGMRNAEFWRRG